MSSDAPSAGTVLTARSPRLRGDRFALDLPSDVKASPGIIRVLAARGAALAYPCRLLGHHVPVVLTGALGNAILHGNGADPRKRVRVDVSIDPDALTAVVPHEGPDVDPARLPAPTDLAPREVASGPGLCLMRQSADEVACFRVGGRAAGRLVLRPAKAA